MLNVIKPSEEYLNSYREACCEMWNNIHDNYLIHNPNEFDEWKTHIFQDLENQTKGINLPNGFVPSETYWIVNNQEYIGSINFRPKLSENLKIYGGHAGLVIRNSKQNGIYGKVAVNFILRKAREYKIEPVLITCEEENKASWRLMSFFKPTKVEKDRINLYGKERDIRRYYFSVCII